ncbi:MAG: hypothetical protein LBE02_00415 [Spirochaetaceae bacterium]|jgi:hypothetical protein|nr:hypothetical protein [Spirochaetaceae bacterium]
MKKLLWAAVFFIWGVSAVAAQNLPSITVVNDTGYTVYGVYISPSAEEEWGEDVLGDIVLAPGEAFNVRLAYPLTVVNVYDILLLDEDDDTYCKWEVTLTNNARISFTLEDLEYQE